MKETGIPNKIIIAGTSTMKLNERFSNLPPPKKALPNRGGRTFSTAPPRYQPQQKFVESYELIPDLMRFPKPVKRRYRPPVRTQTITAPTFHVPIEARLTAPVFPAVRRGRAMRGRVTRGAPITSRTSGGFVQSSRGRGGPQNPIIRNQVRTVFKNRGAVNSRGIQRGNRRTAQPPSKKTVDELNKELDDYMKKKKHAPIVI